MRVQARVDVLLVDRHSVVCEGVRAIIDACPALELVACANRLTEAIPLALSTRPQVVLVGLELPDGEAPDLVRQLRRLAPETRCVVFSPVVDDEVFFRCVVAGAVGFIPDDVHPAQLIDALCRVGSGESLITATAIDDLRARARVGRETSILAQALTGQESRILAMVVEGATNGEIALELSLAEKTVRNYMSSILSKAGVRNRTELTAAVVRSLAEPHARHARVIRLPDAAHVG